MSLDAKQAQPSSCEGRTGRALGLTALIPAAVIALAACSSPSPPVPEASGISIAALPAAPAPAPQSLAESGSTLLYPLFQHWAQGYESQFRNVTITTAGTGSGKGVTYAAAGRAEIGASDAYLSSATVVRYPNLENIPLAIAAQVVTYYLPGLTGNVNLSGTILADMYQGTITMWNDPMIRAANPGMTLPAVRVAPLHRKDSSGDTFLFTSYLATQNPAWASSASYGTIVAWPAATQPFAFDGNAGMVTGCRATPGCVAYIGISYLKQAEGKHLGEAALRNGSGSYELPTAAAISAEAAEFATTTPASGTISLIDGPAPGAYPIINYEYAIVSTRQPNGTRATDIKALLNWILSTGSQPAYLDPVQFQPLPSQVASIARALAAKISS